MPTTTANGKATFSFKSVSPKLQFESKDVKSQVTVKHKKGDVTTSLQFSDATARDVNSLKDVVLTFDYKYNPKITVSGAYDFSNNKHKLTGQWSGKVKGKAASAKSTYTEKDGAIVTECKLGLTDGLTGEVVFNKAEVKSVKAILSRGSLTIEPSLNLVSKAPSMTVLKRTKQGTFKLEYDVKAESASLEWNKYPLKVTATSTVSASKCTHPNVSIVYEKLYHI